MGNNISDTTLSCQVILALEDDLDDNKLPESEHYKALCKYMPQDFLDNFLGWFGQESIERYCKLLKDNSATPSINLDVKSLDPDISKLVDDHFDELI